MSLRAGAPRLVWAVLLVTHAPLLLSSIGRLLAGPTVGDFARVLFVGLSIALFALKIADVPWLRLRADRRTWGIGAVCVLLLHADVLRRTHIVALDNPPNAVLFVMTAGVISTAAALQRRARALDAARARRTRCAAHEALHRLCSFVRCALLPPRFLLLARSCPISRAPPR